MKTIVEFIPGLNLGGAETLVKEYVRLLDKAKYKIYVVITNEKTGSIYERLISELENVELISIGDILLKKIKRTPVCLLNRIQMSLIRAKVIKDVMKSLNPDVVHVHLELLRYLSFLKSSDTNVFYTIHSEVRACFSVMDMPNREGFSLRREYRTAKKRIIHYLERKTARVLLKRGRLTFVALHDKMRDEVNEMFKTERTIILKNGIDFKRFYKRKDVNLEKRKEIGITLNRFIIGNVGWLHEDKNPFFMLEIEKELFRQGIDVHLLLIGSGELKEQLLERADQFGLGQRITILSNRSDVPELLSAMDVFVFPSFYEGLPISLVEAQAIGLKCVVADHITLEVCLSDDYHLVSLSSSVSEWCKVICDKTIKNQKHAKIEEFDMKTVIWELERLYDM